MQRLAFQRRATSKFVTMFGDFGRLEISAVSWVMRGRIECCKKVPRHLPCGPLGNRRLPPLDKKAKCFPVSLVLDLQIPTFEEWLLA